MSPLGSRDVDDRDTLLILINIGNALVHVHVHVTDAVAGGWECHSRKIGSSCEIHESMDPYRPSLIRKESCTQPDTAS